MELLLIRSYYPNGTNGCIYVQGSLIPVCSTIELPWHENKNRISCIMEGRYLIEHRYNINHHDHFLIRNVPGRSLILIHPANDAAKELKGCIAPVTQITGEGKGSESRSAMKKLKAIIDKCEKNEPVYLTIQSNTNDNKR